MTDLEELVQINLTKGIGSVTYKALLTRFGSNKAMLSASAEELKSVSGIGPKLAQSILNSSKNNNVGNEFKNAEDNDIKIVPYYSDDYPSNLKAIYDPPLVLYIKGKIVNDDVMALAVVGSRACTYYGKIQAEKISGSLARIGFTIVSGMARGIDTAVHDSVLKAGCRTIAVLGSGLGNIYPKDNQLLADRIAENGAVISELPLSTPPDNRNFPPRNRIISGLSLGVVIVEAALRSGSLITAQWALDHGKEVFAVPGPIDSARSKGCHKLIKDGAKLVEGTDDIIEELGPLSESLKTGNGVEVKDPRSLRLNGQEAKIFAVLSNYPLGIDDIINTTKLPASVVASTLMILEIKKAVKQLPGKRFVKP
ncbi:MAG: DNA-processing protein DprA [Candidatus Anammoxibacter sp.]